MPELPKNINDWKNSEALAELIQQWQLRKDKATLPDALQQLHRELAQLYTIRIRLAETAGDQHLLADLYHDLTSSLLLSRQFAAAEATIGRQLELNPDHPLPISYLPHVLLFQGQFEVAKQEYLRLKDLVFLEAGPDGPIYYSDAFLADFETFEKLEVIPEAFMEQVDEIKGFLML